MEAKETEANEECDVCGQNHQTEECPELGLSSSKFTPQLSRARLTVPHYLNPVEFSDGRVGVLALESISNKTQLGPFEAKKTMHKIEREDLFVLKILSKDGSYISLDASSEAHCNWMALVQVATTEHEQNCMAYQLGINIYFNTTRDLKVGDELKVWYAPQYAKKLGKSLTPDGNTKSMLGETLITEPYSEEEAEEGMDAGNREADQKEGAADGSSGATDTDTMRPVDDVEGDFTCKKCGQKFTSQFLFAKHIREHLFPVYNYSEGPPRRGRRPVPLKMSGKTGTPGTPGRTRGTVRKRGRPRGSGRGRGGRSFPRAKREMDIEDQEEEEEDELPSKRSKTSEEEETTEEMESDELTNVVQTLNLDKPHDIKSTDTETESENKDEDSESADKQTGGKSVQTSSKDVSTPGQKDTIVKAETLVKTEPDSGLRRSSRSLKGLGRLGRWFRYPGEEISDEEGTPKKKDGELKPRKRYGIAMAASLRKAAMDEMTSPSTKRKTATSSGPKSPRAGVSSPKKSATTQGQKTVTVKTVDGKVEVKTTIASKGKTEDPPGSNHKEETDDKPDEEDKSSPKPVDDDSPKKYLIISDGDKSTAIELPKAFRQLEGLNGSFEKASVTPSATSEPQASSTSANNTDGTASTAGDAADAAEVTDKPAKSSDAEKAEKKDLDEKEEEKEEKTKTDVTTNPDDVEEEEVEQLVKEMAEELSTQPETSTAVIEIRDSDGTVVRTEEAEVVVGTREEVVEIRAPERKNTIADLDGSDALTALVNAAISAHKVPDPIAMVAADLYDDRGSVGAGDDDDGEEYQAPHKGSAGNTSEATSPDAKASKRNQPSKQKRKKRRKGDDPELEELEGLTKMVEGPNGGDEFVCGVCNKHFTMLKYLKLHLPAHTDRFRCKVCGKRFARHESLLKHTCDDTANLVEQVIDDDGNEAFSCKECGRSFNQLNFATRHASMHRTRFTCTKCGRTFLREDLLEEHECVTHQAEDGEVGERHECQICKQSFTNGKYLFRHMAMHTDIYKCEVCGKCYSRKDSLQRHISRCCPQLSQEYSVHMCPNCKKTFGTALGLSNHMINCGKYQCGSCKVAYFSIKDLTEHDCAGKVLNDKASVQFPCKECNKTFASIAYLVRHEASHHDAFKCDLCGKVFIRKEELNWHTPVCTTRQKIIEEGKAPCEVCGEEYYEWLAFKEHHMTHTHPNKCDKCGKRFIKIGTLHNHKCETTSEGGQGADGKSGNLLSCEVCKKTFKNERYLARHAALHGQPEHSCEFCGKSFTRKDYLNDHQCRMPDGTTVRMVRKKNRIFIRDNMACSQCGKSFSSRSNMMKHMKVHGEKLAECHICHKRFHYENYLKLHVATVHEKQYQLQCKHCSKILYSKTGLIAHIKQFHADTIKLYPCPKCGKTFRQKGNMKTHLISHTKERAFKCDICGKAFKYPDQLNRHRLEHTLTQKFSCEMCDKQFVRSYELRNHIRNYHSGFVYVCGVCHECCAHRHTIIRHYKRKHPEVGNVFEEKPEFIDSLQKPVSAATQSRMMVLGAEDLKRTGLLRVASSGGSHHHHHPHHHRPGGVIVAAASGSQDGEVILQGTDLLGSGDQTVQHVLEGPDNTVFILKVVNQEEGGEGGIQEMELTEDTKAHLAQLLQAHGSGQEAITHIQVGDQTLQIHREIEEAEATDTTADGNLEFVQEMKFDPQQLEVLQTQGSQMISVSKTTATTTATSSTPVTLDGADLTSTPSSMGEVLTLEGSAGQGAATVQVVEMEDGRLGRIIQMDDGTMLHMGQVIQLEGGQVIQLDESQLLAMDTDRVETPVVTSTPSELTLDATPNMLQSVLQTGLKVTKRQNSQGQMVMEVEGQGPTGQGDGQVLQVLNPPEMVTSADQQVSLDGSMVATTTTNGDGSGDLLLSGGGEKGEEEDSATTTPQRSATGRDGPISQLELQLTQGTSALRPKQDK